MRGKGGSRTSLQSQLGLQFDERYSILNYQSFWLFWLRTFCYAPRHNIYRYITKTMHLEKSKQLITWDGESTFSWQYPKTRRWKLPCSYMTHSLMENSNSFRIKKNVQLMTGTEQTDVHPHQFRLYQNSYLDTTSLRLLLNRVRRTEHYAKILAYC